MDRSTVQEIPLARLAFEINQILIMILFVYTVTSPFSVHLDAGWIKARFWLANSA